jgi:hypothetical protein
MSQWAVQEHANRQPVGPTPAATGGSVYGADGQIVPLKAAGFGLRRQA